ncbi:MAG: hypothetical protein AB7E82_13965 [Cyclobacteriaceae bacterium]
MLEEVFVSQRYAESFFRNLGAKVIDSIDASAYESASIIHDMNKPIPPEMFLKYSVVFDGGSLEHIFDFPTAIANCMNMVRLGGHFIGSVPANNLFGHGFYQFSPELFFRIFSMQNGFITKRVLLYFNEPDSNIYQVTDPATVKNRVKLMNAKETYMLVIAQKTGYIKPFVSKPQQSDYQFLKWRHDSDDVSEKREKSGLKEFKRSMPKWLVVMFLAWRKRVYLIRTVLRDIGNGNSQYIRRIKSK